MKALTWHGKKDVRIDKVPDPTILDPRDIIIEVTRSAVCGSDLHIYHGHVQEMKKGDILGHEFAGKIVEVGSSVKNLRIGDRVVVPFTISCGECDTCSKGLYSLCTQTNPDKEKLDKYMVITPQDYSVILTCMAVIRAANHNMCASLLQKLAHLLCPTR